MALAQGVGLRIQYLNEFSACMELLQDASSVEYVGNMEKLLRKSTEVCLKYMRHEISSSGYSLAESVVYEPLLNCPL